MMRPTAVRLGVLIMGLIGVLTSPVQALDNSRRETVNQAVIGVLGGARGGTYIELVQDLATVLDDGYDLRILPITGRGSVRAIEDLLYLRGIDIAFVQADVIEHYRRSADGQDIDQTLRYVTGLYNEEVHVVAQSGIPSIEDLAGKRVNIGPEDTGTHLTIKSMFKQLGIEIEATTYPFDIAFHMLKSGELDAWARVVGKPVELVAALDQGDGLHLLEIPASRIKGPYVRASFTPPDYPGLIKSGTTIGTFAVQSVMAVYNWPAHHPRRQRIERFITRFRETYTSLQTPPFHRKWLDVQPNTDVPGWTRF
jgi:uncharacterized protein